MSRQPCNCGAEKVSWLPSRVLALSRVAQPIRAAATQKSAVNCRRLRRMPIAMATRRRRGKLIPRESADVFRARAGRLSALLPLTGGGYHVQCILPQGRAGAHRCPCSDGHTMYGRWVAIIQSICISRSSRNHQKLRISGEPRRDRLPDHCSKLCRDTKKSRIPCGNAAFLGFYPGRTRER